MQSKDAVLSPILKQLPKHESRTPLLMEELIKKLTGASSSPEKAGAQKKQRNNGTKAVIRT